MDTFYWST